MILAGGGLPQNRQNNGYLYLLDIFPSLCDLMGLKIPSSVEGQSFAKALTNGEWSGRPFLYFAYNDLMRAVKEDGYKLIEYRGPQDHTQLFDLKADPGECHDLSEEQPDRRALLQERLRQCAACWENGGHPYSRAFWDHFER